MHDKSDRGDLYRQLELSAEVIDAHGAFDSESALACLKRYFDRLIYVEPHYDGWDDSADFDHFYALNNRAAKELFDLCPSAEEALSFVTFVCRHRPVEDGASEKKARPQQSNHINFWLNNLRQHLPDDVAMQGHCNLYHAIFATSEFSMVQQILDTTTKHFVAKPETIELVRHFIENVGKFDLVALRRRTVLRPSSISKYLNDRYENGQRDVWPLIQGYWSVLYFDAELREFERMWKLCEHEPERRTIGEAVSPRLAEESDLHPIARSVFDAYMESHADDMPLETLRALLGNSNETIFQRGFFWLAELYRDLPATFDSLMETATQDENAKRRAYAFHLAFFHYYNSRELVPRIVEAAWADPENEEEFKRIMTGDKIRSILPLHCSGRALKITMRGNEYRRARIFDKTCKKAKIKSGVRIPVSLTRTLLESLSNIVDSDLSKKTMMRMAYKSLNPGERAFLNKVHHYREFNQLHKDRLNRIPRDDAAAISLWLEEVWEQARSRFGFKGQAVHSIEKACGHLLPDDQSQAAATLHAHHALLREIEDRTYYVISENLELKRRSHKNAELSAEINTELSAEIKERAFFILYEGKEETTMAAMERAVDDTIRGAG